MDTIYNKKKRRKEKEKERKIPRRHIKALIMRKIPRRHIEALIMTSSILLKIF
jgi:hypothetical protein